MFYSRSWKTIIVYYTNIRQLISIQNLELGFWYMISRYDHLVHFTISIHDLMIRFELSSELLVWVYITIVSEFPQLES